MKKSQKVKTFNKGTVLFGSFFATLALYITAMKYPYSIVWLLFILGSIFASKKIRLENMWTYILLIFFTPTIGTPFYCYNGIKQQAKNLGINVNTKKGVFFWFVMLLLILFNLHVILRMVMWGMREDISIQLMLIVNYMIATYLTIKILRKQNK